MASQFYMTLPSNSASTNSAAEFLTTLPVNIHLDGEWEVGLAEIIYGNTWFNITNANNIISFYSRVLDLDVKIKIATGRYESCLGLLETIANTFDERSKTDNINLSRKLYFAYNDSVKRCQMMIDTDEIHNLKMSPGIAYMLGFDLEQISLLVTNTGKHTLYAHFPVDMSNSLNHLYIYCDILKPQIVGNVLAPLLQIVSIQGTYTDAINRLYITPHYISVLKKIVCLH